MPKVHLCQGIVQYIVSQTINHLRNRARAHKFAHIHIHIPHTLLEPDSLIHRCHGNPIKGGHSGCNSGEISLSFFYLSLSLCLSHTHKHLPFLSLPVISICLSPLLSLPYLFLLSLHHPWCTSLPVSLQYCYLFIFSPSTSQVNVNMSSHFSNPHCVNISDFCLAYTHTEDHSVCLSIYVSVFVSLPSILRDEEYIWDWGGTSLLVPSPIKREIYGVNQSEGSLRGQL